MPKFKIKNFVKISVTLMVAFFGFSLNVGFSSAQTNCILSGAYWTQNFCGPPILGSPLHMVVDGAGCSGFQVAYEIYDQNFLPGLTGHVGSVMGTFDEAGFKVDTVWISAGKDLDDSAHDWT